MSMNAQIVLGCNGYRRFGISMCRGTTNAIADLRKLGSDSEEILSYLDGHCKLFDRVNEDLNQINNIIQFLTRHEALSKHLEPVLQDYIAFHRGCGLYMFVDPIETGGKK